MALIFLVALAWHEGIRHQIDRYIKFNDGTPMYYIGYAVAVTVIALAFKNISS